MTIETCACPSCSTATLIGSDAVGLCTSCGSLSLAGTAVPLVAVVIAALAVRALFVARRMRPATTQRPMAAARLAAV
jgi:hypothetical protein